MVVITEEKCAGCGICVMTCPEEALRLWGYVRVEKERCTECLMCIDECPAEALSPGGEEIGGGL